MFHGPLHTRIKYTYVGHFAFGIAAAKVTAVLGHVPTPLKVTFYPCSVEENTFLAWLTLKVTRKIRPSLIGKKENLYY